MHPDETVRHSALDVKVRTYRTNNILLKLVTLFNIHMFQVALVNVVHIKDSVCTLPTSILAQYLKQANGQLSCLKVGICIQYIQGLDCVRKS